MTKVADIRQKTDDELAGELTGLKKEALNLRFQRASGQLESTSRVKTVRKDIARINTVMNERKRKA